MFLFRLDSCIYVVPLHFEKCKMWGRISLIFNSNAGLSVYARPIHDSKSVVQVARPGAQRHICLPMLIKILINS